MTDLSTKESVIGEKMVENRTLQVITTEIKTIHAQAQQMILNYSIEIGRRLTEAKSLLEHGEWGTWLKEEVAFSKSTANNLMRLYEEYGASQFCLFGAEAKSQTLGDLPYTKALKLIALPEEEREEFAKEHNVSELSTRDLDKLLKEREQALAETEEAQAEKAKIQAEKNRLELEVTSAIEKMNALEEELEKLRNAPIEVAIEKVVDQEAIDTAVEIAREEEKQAQIQALEEARRKAQEEVDTALTAVKVAQEQAENSKKTVEHLEQSKEEAKLQIMNLEKQLASVSSPDVAIFKVHFVQVQEHMNKMLEITQEMEAKQDTEGANKLCNAFRKLLENTLTVVNPSM